MWVKDDLTGTLFQGCVKAGGTKSRQVSPLAMMSVGSWGAHSGSRLMVTRVRGPWSESWGQQRDKNTPDTLDLIPFQEFPPNPPSGLTQAPSSARGAL